jgi:hypothetical protein
MEDNSLKPRHFVPMLGLDKYMKEVGAYGVLPYSTNLLNFSD